MLISLYDIISWDVTDQREKLSWTFEALVSNSDYTPLNVTLLVNVVYIFMFTVLDVAKKEPSEPYRLVILSLIHVTVLTNKASLATPR